MSHAPFRYMSSITPWKIWFNVLFEIVPPGDPSPPGTRLSKANGSLKFRVSWFWSQATQREAQWLISYDPLLWPSVFDTLRCGERAIPQNIPYHHIPYTTPYIYIYINHISHIKKYKYISNISHTTLFFRGMFFYEKWSPQILLRISHKQQLDLDPVWDVVLGSVLNLSKMAMEVHGIGIHRYFN